MHEPSTVVFQDFWFDWAVMMMRAFVFVKRVSVPSLDSIAHQMQHLFSVTTAAFSFALLRLAQTDPRGLVTCLLQSMYHVYLNRKVIACFGLGEKNIPV